jgi:hypothetical protein
VGWIELCLDVPAMLHLSTMCVYSVVTSTVMRNTCTRHPHTVTGWIRWGGAAPGPLSSIMQPHPGAMYCQILMVLPGG